MKQLFIAILMLVSSQGVFAQSEPVKTVADWNPDIYDEGKLYPGYIIKLEGDTVRGFIKSRSRCSLTGMGSSNQNTAEFYLYESDRKPVDKFKPSEIKGYKIADKEYQSIKYSGGLFNKPNFNIIVKDGPIRIYEWYSMKDNFATIRKQSGENWRDYYERLYETKLIIAKDPKEPVELAMLGLFFTKNFLPMIADYPELSEKVKNKEKGYTLLNIFDVIEEYNNWSEAKK